MFDLLLTDPPYGINIAKIGTVGSKPETKRGGFGWAATTQFEASDWDKSAPQDWLFGMMREKTKQQIIFGGNYFNLPPSSCWLVWDKDNAGTNFADCELAWTNLSKAVRKFKYCWNGMLQENMAKKEIRMHPTQKPLAVMKWCLSLVPDAKTILDPFAGSGTTLRAAKDFGLQAVGIERDERYCEIIVERLKQQTLGF